MTPGTAARRVRIAWPATAGVLAGTLLALTIAAVPPSRLAQQSLNAFGGSIPAWIAAALEPAHLSVWISCARR